MAAKHVIKLDREREIKFTIPAIATLDEFYQINVFSPASYVDFPPSKIVSLIWAGQLHTKNPLRRNSIASFLPTSREEYMGICVIVAEAIRDAIQDPTPKTPLADSK